MSHLFPSSLPSSIAETCWCGGWGRVRISNFSCVQCREVMWLRRLTDRVCTIRILQFLNSCIALLFIMDNKTWQGSTQANTKKKLHLHLPNLESKLDYYSMSSTNSLWSHLSDFWWTFRGENRVPPYRSSTFKKPSILCSVRDSRVGSDDNEPLAPLLCNPGWDLRGTYKCLWEADISDLFWKGRK